MHYLRFVATRLVIIRFLFGMGEAGAYPNITRALHNWFPVKERGIAQGSIWFFSRLMGGLTPLIWMLLVVRWEMPWRLAFAGFGVLGASWCVAFALWFRNRPEEHPAVNEAERELIRAGAPHDADRAHAGVPWGKVFRSPTLWCLCLMYACTSYGWYFNLNYLPAYLEEQHGVLRNDTLGSLFKGGPLILGAAGCLLGGWGTDFLLRRTGTRRLESAVVGRRRPGSVRAVLPVLHHRSQRLDLHAVAVVGRLPQ